MEISKTIRKAPPPALLLSLVLLAFLLALAESPQKSVKPSWPSFLLPGLPELCEAWAP